MLVTAHALLVAEEVPAAPLDNGGASASKSGGVTMANTATVDD